MSSPRRMASDEVGERDTAEAAVASRARRSWGCTEQVQDCRRGVHPVLPGGELSQIQGDGRFDTEAAIRAVFRLGMTHTSSDASGIRYCARKEWCFRTTGARTLSGPRCLAVLARKRRKRCVGQEF